MTEQFRHLKMLLLRRGRSSDDAEDLVQEAFLRLHSFLHKGREVREPDAFLVRTALNLAVDQGRRERRLRSLGVVPHTDEVFAVADRGPTPEEWLSADEALEHLRQVLGDQFSLEVGEAFLLHRIEGFSYQEIADHLGLSLRRVERHIARAAGFVSGL